MRKTFEIWGLRQLPWMGNPLIPVFTVWYSSRDHRERVDDYAFAHEFEDAAGLAALEEYRNERNGRPSVVGRATQ
eukprot:SAG11_NODE_3602_length_2345_cov_3.522262_4_plen_75_part_00